MRIEFTTASRRHRIGRAHARHVMATSTPSPVTTNRGEQGWLYIGPDERGVVLEVIAVVTGTDSILVIHAMPYEFRGGSEHD